MADSGLDKSLLAFLNGISKRIYLGEGDSITDDFLRDEILKVTHEDFEYGPLVENRVAFSYYKPHLLLQYTMCLNGQFGEYVVLLKKYSTLVSTLVSTDMDFIQLDAFLSSQMKKRQGALTEEQAAAVMKFWKLQKNKIHQRLIESAVWSKHLDSFSWRIDVKTRSRHIDQLNQPTAIMEMNLKSDKSEVEGIRFEMDEKKLSELLSQVEDIDRSIDMYAHT